jgi:hypothetical protein
MNTPYTEGFYAGMKWEQERIIKIIEGIVDFYGVKNAVVIALIKGEQND